MYTKAYQSLMDFYSDLGGRNVPSNGTDVRFCGATLEKIDATKYAWTEPFEKGESQESKSECKKVKIWSDYDGDEMDVERMFAGMPCLSMRKKVFGAIQKRGIEVMVCDIGNNCNVTAESIAQKAKALMARIDAKEEAGNRVEVHAKLNIEDWLVSGGKNSTMEITITLKNADEPLNIARIAAALSPWFLRHWVFIWQDVHADRLGKGLSFGRGHAVKIDNE
jgi:hypothetical protein